MTLGLSAASGKGVPFGTAFTVDGVGVVVVQDRVADWVNKRYNGKVLDLYFDNHADAVAFGKQELEVFEG